MGEEGKIYIDGSVGETTGLRWPARATTGNALLPCCANRKGSTGRDGRKLASQRLPRPRREATEISERKKSIIGILSNVAELGASRMEETIGKAGLRDAAIRTGVAVDKMLALTGQMRAFQIANIIMPTEQERAERRAIDAKLDAIARRLAASETQEAG